MTPKDSLKTAIGGLRTNKSRSALTILGIVIGITAIILVMSVSQGATDLILAQVQGIGSRTITVEPGREPRGPSEFGSIFTTSLRDREVKAIKNPALVRGVSEVAPSVISTATILFQGETKNANILGTTPSIADILEIQPEKGSFFTTTDVRSRTSVAIIGSEVKEELFGPSDAVGETIKVGGRNFKVIGVFAPVGQKGFFNIDKQVIIPVSTAQQYLLGISHYNIILVKSESEIMVERTARDIRLTLRELHNITDPEKDDFHVHTQADIAERVGTITGILTALLVSVAAISLVVGGIGIMNIMLVSVTERTREIGLRKALGATEKDIMIQFLLESVFLTLAGGIIGIVFGAILSFATAIILSRFLDLAWTFTFPISAALLGLGIAASVGLIFGLYPARQASLKSPIEALRYE
ncbi:ABC transporter permease [Patescibacteria group bacterium]|nr:ABC transporter permease [Patescibacteria group bacterium]